MGFFKKTKPQSFRSSMVKKPFYRRRRWKIFFSVLAILFIGIGSLAFYLLHSGSNIFENGLGGISLVKSFIGGDTQSLRGEDSDRINILVTGMGGPSHPGGYLTDSIMLVSIQPKEKKVAMLSIPRDLLVPISGHGEDKINSAFADGYNDYSQKNCAKKSSTDCTKNAMTAGANLSSQVVSNVVGLPIHYYISVEFSGFEKIIDTLGGVDINVERAIYDPSFPSDDMIHYSPFSISAGLHHLDGVTALKYARSRETTSDFDRAARQQRLLVAIKEKAAKTNFLANPASILSIFNSLTGSLYTNFSPAEIKSLVEVIKEVDKSNFISKVLSSAPDGFLVNYNNGSYYLKPKAGNFKEIQAFAANIFNTKKDISVEIANGAKLTPIQISGIVSDLKKDSSANFQVTTSTAAKTAIAQTTIYDYSDGSLADVLKHLRQKYNAKVMTGAKTAQVSADFYIIIGQNYLPN